jgi:hypothetical protein
MTVLVFVALQVGAAPFQDGLRAAGAGMVGLSPGWSAGRFQSPQRKRPSGFEFWRVGSRDCVPCR